MKTKKKIAGKPRKAADPFVKVPLWFAVEAAKATRSLGTLVWIWLLYRAWKNGTHGGKLATPLANSKLSEWGVSRKVKCRILRDLEQAALITVERQPRKTPIVTLVVL
jgi:hypothetical protein